MKVQDILRWQCPKFPHVIHEWVVRGIHLGAIGTESLIEIENVTHKPGWTGEWETHQIMFVPEVLLRDLPVVRHDRPPSPTQGSSLMPSTPSKYETHGGRVSRSQTYMKIIDLLDQLTDQSAVMAHLHATEGSDKDALIAQGWRGIAEMMQKTRSTVTDLAMGKMIRQ